MSDGRAQTFGVVAEHYDRFRPGPPGEAVRWLLGSQPRTVALDLAAGTGAMTRRLAEQVGSVIAVEPDDRMRAVLAARSPEVTALRGTGEEIPLEQASVDAVVVSSAWHWLDPTRAVPEIARVLRPGGMLGVIWNGLDTTVPWVREYAGFRRSLLVDDGSTGERPGGRRRELTLPASAPFTPPEGTVFHWNREMSRADLISLLGTFSGVITAAEDRQQHVFEKARHYLQDLGHVTDDAVIDIPFRVVCWRAERLQG